MSVFRLKCLFVGDLSSASASGRQRLWALEQCMETVVPFNKQEYPVLFPRCFTLLARLLRQPLLLRNSSKLCRELVAKCNVVKPDIVWIEWAREISESTLQAIESICPSAILISFQDDNPWGERASERWVWNEYFKLVPYFDLHLVKRASDGENLAALGAAKTKIWKHGIYSPYFFPTSETEIDFPVSFVGTCLDDRAVFIGELLDHGIPIHVFGNLWDVRSDLPRKYPSFFHNAVSGEEYATVIRKSQICLGLVSASNQDEWTMRTYEIPGCAKAFVGQRTKCHEQLFQEGESAEFFDSSVECRKKLEFLLANPERCYQMGQIAHQHFITNNFTIENRAQRLVEFIRREMLSVREVL